MGVNGAWQGGVSSLFQDKGQNVHLASRTKAAVTSAEHGWHRCHGAKWPLQ